MKFLIGMLTLASAIALTGCDDVLENGSDTPAYSIVLDGVDGEAYVFETADTKLALLVVNTGDEATGALTAELTGDSEAFTLSNTKLPSIKAGKSGTLVIAPVAELAAGTYEAAVVLSGEAGIAATLNVSFTVGEAGVLTVIGVEVGSHYEAEVYDYPDSDIADSADLRNIMSVFKFGGTGVGTAGNGTLEIGLQTPDGADFTADGDFLVVLKAIEDNSAPLKYKASVPFTGGSATLDWNEMTNTPVTGGNRPAEPVIENPKLGSNGISLNVNECLTYPQVIEGYEELPPFTITVTNTLSQPTGTLTLNLGSGDTWFTLSTGILQSIEAGGTATFTIAPKTGLRSSGYCSYMEIYGDNGIWARFNLSFAVENAGSPDDAIHSVFLDMRDGMYIDVNEDHLTLRIRHGFTFKQPADVFKPGYTFGGWYRDAAYKTLWNFDTDTVTSTMVLYAKWIAVD
jgi:uncharacterized repeat protein (TIGR02543 family)